MRTHLVVKEKSDHSPVANPLTGSRLFYGGVDEAADFSRGQSRGVSLGKSGIADLALW
jgi:hypothetical protein